MFTRRNRDASLVRMLTEDVAQVAVWLSLFATVRALRSLLIPSDQVVTGGALFQPFSFTGACVLLLVCPLIATAGLLIRIHLAPKGKS